LTIVFAGFRSDFGGEKLGFLPGRDPRAVIWTGFARMDLVSGRIFKIRPPQLGRKLRVLLLSEASCYDVSPIRPGRRCVGVASGVGVDA